MLMAPPPWTLTGNAVILVAHFPEAFVRAHGFLAPYQQRAYRGWIGTVMLVDYKTSPVGPYQELLFIPGLFRFGKTTSFSISKIYASTTDSLWNGRQNWGIPKELADFSFVLNHDGSQTISVQYEGRLLLSVRTRPWGPCVPITTKFMPGFRIVQERLMDPQPASERAEGLLLTRPSAAGTVRLASSSDLHVEPGLFPNLAQIKPRLVFSLENVILTFPPPEAC